MLRYIVERISDGEFLELELPITVSGAGSALNGPGAFSGTVAPDVGGLRDAQGTLLIDPYATLIHEEADGVIRGTWIVTRSELDGDTWSVEGAGFTAFFRDRPYEGEYRGIQVDPADVARHVITHAQGFAGAELGVTLTGSSPVRVGTDSDDQVNAAQATVDSLKAQIEAKKKDLDAAKKTAKASPTTGNKNAVSTLQNQVDALNVSRKAADEKLRVAKDRQSADGGAWKILWWDTPDCFDAMMEAIEAAGMELVEWSGWNADRTRILKEIRVMPRAGRKQDSLAFVEGDNILETVVVEDDADQYANTVVAIGAGEGRDALRVTLSRSDNRRRKVYVLDAKHVTKKATLEKLARAELTARATRLRVAAIRVDASHPNAARGTFGVGDTILIDAEIGWLGRKRIWRRIEELEWVGLDVADLMLGDA